MSTWKEKETWKADKWLKVSRRRGKGAGDNQAMSTLGWIMVRITGDGNCFYRCISYHMYGNEEHHAEIWSKVVDHLEQEKSKYLYYMDEDMIRRWQGKFMGNRS